VSVDDSAEGNAELAVHESALRSELVHCVQLPTTNSQLPRPAPTDTGQTSNLGAIRPWKFGVGNWDFDFGSWELEVGS
jgi:hypothetical protein